MGDQKGWRIPTLGDAQNSTGQGLNNQIQLIANRDFTNSRTTWLLVAFPSQVVPSVLNLSFRTHIKHSLVYLMIFTVCSGNRHHYLFGRQRVISWTIKKKAR